MTAVIVVLVVLAVLMYPIGRIPAPPNGPPIGFQIPSSAGNATAGWTYTLIALAIPAWEDPVPLVWGNLRPALYYSDNATTLTRFHPPSTTLAVLDAGGSRIAEFNLSSGLWTDGYSVLVETGQALVLHGPFPPGANTPEGSTTAFIGPVFDVQYANAGQAWDLGYPLYDRPA